MRCSFKNEEEGLFLGSCTFYGIVHSRVRGRYVKHGTNYESVFLISFMLQGHVHTGSSEVLNSLKMCAYVNCFHSPKSTPVWSSGFLAAITMATDFLPSLLRLIEGLGAHYSAIRTGTVSNPLRDLMVVPTLYRILIKATHIKAWTFKNFLSMLDIVWTYTDGFTTL